MAFGRTALDAPTGGARSARSTTSRASSGRSTRTAKAPKSQSAGGGKAKVERRYHQTVRNVDVWSVLKVALCFYLCALVVLLVAGIVLWVAADAAGLVHNLEKFMGDLLDDQGFRFRTADLLRAATLLGLVFVSLSTVMTVLAAAFYNLFADLVGGVEITVAEEA